jgi:hypothetical protein
MEDKLKEVKNYAKYTIEAFVKDGKIRHGEALIVALNSIDLAYHLGKEEGKKEEWISVEERLPKANENVLTCYGDFKYIGYMYDGEFYDAREHNLIYIDFWQPLPEGRVLPKRTIKENKQ